MSLRSKIDKERRDLSPKIPLDSHRIERWKNNLKQCRVVVDNRSDMNQEDRRIRYLVSLLFTTESRLLDKQMLGKELSSLFQQTSNWLGVIRSLVDDMYPLESREKREEIINQNLSFIN